MILILSFSNSLLVGQELDPDNYPIIEIFGTAEKEIDPDEIIIEVLLKEKFEGRKKVTINEQEEKLISGMKSININEDKIKLSDSEAGYIKVNWLKKDVIATKSYIIEAKDANQVKQIFAKLDEIEILNASISKVNHSKIKEFEKQVRIEAIKDAKEKAEYLLEAIDKKLGIPVRIYEANDVISDINVRGSRSGATDYYIDGIRVRSNESFKSYAGDAEIQYQKIKLKAVIYAKFKIE